VPLAPVTAMVALAACSGRPLTPRRMVQRRAARFLIFFVAALHASAVSRRRLVLPVFQPDCLRRPRRTRDHRRV